MKLIISAMKSEINEILKKIGKIEQINDNLFEIYKHNNFLFVISGIGTFNANICLTYILNKFTQIKEIYNFGVVGSISEKIKPLDIVFVDHYLWFLDGNNIQKCNTLKFPKSHIFYETILTSDFFLQKKVFDNMIEKFYKHPLILKNISIPKIVDMEFASYCFVAKNFNINIYGIKAVSDFILHRSNENEYKKNMLYCKEILKNTFFEIFMKEI